MHVHVCMLLLSSPSGYPRVLVRMLSFTCDTLGRKYGAVSTSKQCHSKTGTPMNTVWPVGSYQIQTPPVDVLGLGLG